MSRENSLWKWLARARIHFGPFLHLSRLENLVGAGHPDVEGHLKGKGQIWLELKAVERPKRLATPLDLKHVRDSQVEWHKRRALSGQASWFLIQVGSGGEALRYLVPGTLGEELQASKFTEADLLFWSVVDPKAKPPAFIEGCFL